MTQANKWPGEVAASTEPDQIHAQSKDEEMNGESNSMSPAQVTKLSIKFGEESRLLHLRGRAAWAMQELINAGAKGCTPISTPAPRWSHYVYQLRGYGLPVETIHEAHGGPFPGHHARYVLRIPVEVIQQGEAA